MLDTIFIGMSGLSSYAKGLKVIGNNLTNVNTPGFKSSQLQFSDLFYQASTGGQPGNGATSAQLGSGVGTLSAAINFNAGDLKASQNTLDLAISGNGMFVLHDGAQSHYTRAGSFEFNKEGILVNKTDALHVSGLDAQGNLVDVSLADLRHNLPKATGTINFKDKLASDLAIGSNFVVNGVNIIDALGGSHSVTLTLKNMGAGDWDVTISDVTGTLGTGSIKYAGGVAVAGSSVVTLAFAPAGVPALSVNFDFSKSESLAGVPAGTSTLAVDSQDGYLEGDLTKVAFDAEGTLIASYTNGQTTKGARLALARFDSDQDVVQLSGNQFDSASKQAVHVGYAKTGNFGSLLSSQIEGSNVHMEDEFSNLIVMQRGYQASSHVISTANDMIQELFDMKGHR